MPYGFHGVHSPTLALLYGYGIVLYWADNRQCEYAAVKLTDGVIWAVGELYRGVYSLSL